MNTHHQQSSSRQNVEHKNYNYNSFNHSKSSTLEQRRMSANALKINIIYKLLKTNCKRLMNVFIPCNVVDLSNFMGAYAHTSEQRATLWCVSHWHSRSEWLSKLCFIYLTVNKSHVRTHRYSISDYSMPSSPHCYRVACSFHGHEHTLQFCSVSYILEFCVSPDRGTSPTQAM